MKKDNKENIKEPEYIASLYSLKRSKILDKSLFYKGGYYALLIISVCLCVIVLILGLRQKTEIPYVIEINREGRANYVENGVHNLKDWTPTDATIIATLKNYIISLRGVSVDKEIQKERIENVYSSSLSYALNTADNYIRNTLPLERAKKENVNIDVYYISKLNNNGLTYEIDFNEIIYSPGFTNPTEKSYRAIVSIEFHKSDVKEIQKTNPLGIYVVDLQINEIKSGYVKEVNK